MDGLYNYDLTVPPGQNSVFINPIAIFEDMVVEGDEFFFLAVAVVPQPGLSVQLNTMLATVVIIDNDR